MTRAQEGLWMAYVAAPQHTPYNLTMKISFSADSKVSIEALLKGIRALTARHGILRSTFHDDKTFNTRPFVAEWDRNSAFPSVKLVSGPKTALGLARVQNILRTAVDLTSEFAVRWVIIHGDSETTLYLITHHIAVDGTSMSSLSSELFALLEDKSVESNAEGFHKAHMAETLFRASPAFQIAKAFWVDQSRDVLPVKWAVEKPTTPSTNYREIESWYKFSKEELATWGTRFKTSWFRVAAAAVGLLVRTHSESTMHDQALTVAFAGRAPSMISTVGHFANALPISVPLSQVLRSANPTFDSLVRLLSSAISAAKKHERFSFPDLSHALNSSGLQTPRTQVAITLSPQLSRPECTLYPVEGPYDLFFCFLEAQDSVSLGVIYDPLLFSPKTITDFKTDFRRIIDLAVTPEPLSLTAFPSLIAQIPHGSTFQSMFELQAAASPAALALHSAELSTSMTYAQLNESANRIANYLRQSGVQRNQVVLLHLQRGFLMMEWIMGVLKSGAVYAVADPHHPLERTRGVFSVAEPSMLVDDGSNDEVVQLANDADITVIDVKSVNLSAMSSANVVSVSEPSDLAYIVFTSGSTGNGLPKGVEIEHSNLTSFVTGAHASGYFPLCPGSRVLQFATFAFDAAVLEWAQCLAIGATLCFAETPYTLVGDYLADVIEINKVSHMHLTPSVLATLPATRPLPSLTHISVGGEMVPDSLIEIWRRRVRLQNAYGPTECTVVMSHQPQPRGAHDKHPSASIIGKSHAPMDVFVSNDEFTRLLPADEVGEICIAGPQVGRGYRKRPDLTAERFAVHPANGKRLYRTGDRGKLLPDGRIFLLGRLDREIKIRGYRIDLDELERSIVDAMPAIAYVSAQPDSTGAALCVFVSPASINGEMLRQRLESRVPRYMIPKSVYCLPDLPRNTNDKTDHRTIQQNLEELIARANGADSASSPQKRQAILPPTPPRTESPSPVTSNAQLLTAVSNIVASILDVHEIPSPSSNFFDLGGNSILVTKLTETLRTLIPVSSPLSVVEVFANPTVQEMVALLRDKRPRFEVESLDPVEISPKITDVDLEFDFLPIHKTEGEVRDIWGAVLGHEVSSSTANFFDVGGNSLTLVEVQRGIQKQWPDAKIQIVDLFQYSTVESQAKLISNSMPSRPRSTSPRSTAVSNNVPVSPPPASNKIAVIGIAGRFPGASSPDELYQLLMDRKEALSSFPDIPQGMDVFPGGKYVPKRGALPDALSFDAAQWGISADEAKDMDPQQRLFLTVANEALQDADALPAPGGSNNIGLYVGAANTTWHSDQAAGDDFHRTHHEILTPSISALTAYHLNLQGPNITLNTACSSGMVAMSVAVEQLRSGSCDIAVTGGVSIAFPQTGYVTAENQIFSVSGHCRPFDHRSDGTLPSDAVCALVLRRLDDAVAAGDEIYAVISGVAFGSDGHVGKAGPTVPSPRGQAETIKRAWNDAGISANKLVYAELHGSGTPIGDALELEGLHLARSALGAGQAPYTVGSNKGNLGNCEAASGLVSIIKLCKSIQNGVVPPLQSFDVVNPFINTSLPVKIASESVPITAGDVLSVSSTGLGGVNAHCVLSFPPRDHARSEVVRSTARSFALPTQPETPGAPSSNVTLQAIINQASSILSMPVAADTCLKDAGLDSKGQMMLMRRIQDAIPGCQIPVSVLLSAGCTAALLASAIIPAASDPSAPAYATVLRSASSTDVFVLLAPGGGSCASYLALANHLPTDATVIALDHPRMHVAGPSLSVVELAETYASSLRARFATMKRCVVVGASFGGLVGLELVQLLKRANVDVQAVVMLDTPWPSTPSSALSTGGFIRNVFGARTRPTLCAESSFDTVNPEFDVFTAKVAEALLLAPASEKSDIEGLDWKALAKIYLQNLEAVRTFVVPSPSVSSVPVKFIGVRNTVQERSAPWKVHFPTGLKVEDVSGEHATMYMGENAPIVAALIVGAMQQDLLGASEILAQPEKWEHRGRVSCFYPMI
ncbi:hypothetical protein R3P38DRAFT_2519696 [Favolaschia claudopus]|uniref:Uncharacterized protein n=1 Tax=Favolaschia claudopus TaxID=2862362 RepID=A0AAW0C4E5_9AGAR